VSNPPSDVREAILARLIVLFKQISGVNKVFRNKLRIDDEHLPAIAVLDGDETPDDSSYGKGRPANGPVVMVMRPEIYGFVTGDDDAVGPELNSLRSAILKTVLNDATLLGLCKDGDIRYEGFSSAMANGRSLEGEMGLALAFVYVLRPKTL
jgi:hypothetical protein